MLTYNWSGTVNGCDCTYRTQSREYSNLQFTYNSSSDGLNQETDLDDKYNENIPVSSEGIE
jgi:hypothetical protein